MKKAFLLVLILFISVISTACINNLAVQQLNSKAKAYLDKGDYDNAISRLKSSIDLDGTIFETHYNLGIAYTQAEKYPDAVEAFQNAIKLKPNFSDTYYSLAVAQENYAKDIIDGTIKNSDVKAQEAVSENSNSDKPVKLSSQDKALIVQLLNDSIESYKTYIEKAPEAQDKSDIEEKIDYLTKQVPIYSSDSVR